MVMTTSPGVADAFIGGWIGIMGGLGSVDEFSLGSLLTPVVGALVILFVYRTFKK